MAKIISFPKQWTDGMTVHDVDYNQDREILRTAINDTDTRVDGIYTKTEIDSKINAMAVTTSVASGTSFPSGTSFNESQLFWRSDLKQMYAWSVLAASWEPVVDLTTINQNDADEAILRWMGV